MDIQVKFNREIKTISVEADTTIENLHKTLQEVFDLVPENQTIIFKGKKLTDSTLKLSSVGISKGSKLLLVGSSTPINSQNQTPSSSNPFSIPDLTSKPPRVIGEKYLTVPPHSNIIKKGPPPGCIEGNSFQLENLPQEPFIVRDKDGDVAKLSFRSDELVIQSEKNIERIFYSEIISYGIQAVPGYENHYLAVGVHIKGKEIWSYFVPKQYRMLIEIIFQSRRVASII